MTTILTQYEARLAELRNNALQLNSSHAMALALAVVSTGTVALLAYLAFAQHSVPLVSALLPVPLIIYAVSLAKKRSALLMAGLRLQTYYQRAINRLNGDWSSEGFEGNQFSIPDHCYEKDLNILGESSLFQLLCTCRTEVGRRQLAEDLLHTPSLQVARLRQDAIRELQPLNELREKVQLVGDFSFQESTWEAISEWLDAPVTNSPLWFRLIALASSISLASLLLVAITFYFPWSYLQNWIISLLLLNGILAMFYREKVSASMQPIRSIGSEIAVLGQGLAFLQNRKFNSPLLSQLVGSLSDSDASGQIRKLQRLIGITLEKDKEWFYALSRALLTGTQVFLAIEQWKSTNALPMRRWLSAWGEFEALIALANYAYENPANSFPEFCEDNSLLEIAAMGHPLLPAAECIRNDIWFNDDRKLYIVSGSNMAGKSTLLRTIGLNIVLAYAGAPVCASKLVLSRFSLCASLSIHDSLSNRKSKFLAEMDRLKQALQTPLEEGPVLFLIDEILSGTNSKDRRAASEAIVRSLIARGAMGALSTHDLALTELALLPELLAVNVHMGSKGNADPLDFDYLIKPGVTNQSSALAIARLAGVNVEAMLDAG